MSHPRNKELENKLLRLFQDEKLRSKDDLLTLFCKHLGFEHAENKLPSRSTEYWGEGQVAQVVENESFEIHAQVADRSGYQRGLQRSFRQGSAHQRILQKAR